jgi:hypothetical protein
MVWLPRNTIRKAAVRHRQAGCGAHLGLLQAAVPLAVQHYLPFAVHVFPLLLRLLGAAGAWLRQSRASQRRRCCCLPGICWNLLRRSASTTRCQLAQRGAAAGRRLLHHCLLLGWQVIFQCAFKRRACRQEAWAAEPGA